MTAETNRDLSFLHLLSDCVSIRIKTGADEAAARYLQTQLDCLVAWLFLFIFS